MFILLEHSDSIGTLTFNQPAKRNALSEALVEELIAALTDFQQAGIRVVVIRSSVPCVRSRALLPRSSPWCMDQSGGSRLT